MTRHEHIKAILWLARLYKAALPITIKEAVTKANQMHSEAIKNNDEQSIRETLKHLKVFK